MKIERWREHTINLGNYENVKIGARVSVDAAAGDTDDVIADLNKLLDQALEEDMIEATANVPKGQKTHAETWRNGE
jgi:hypothetical protein